MEKWILGYTVITPDYEGNREEHFNAIIVAATEDEIKSTVKSLNHKYNEAFDRYCHRINMARRWESLGEDNFHCLKVAFNYDARREKPRIRFWYEEAPEDVDSKEAANKLWQAAKFSAANWAFFPEDTEKELRVHFYLHPDSETPYVEMTRPDDPDKKPVVKCISSPLNYLSRIVDLTDRHGGEKYHVVIAYHGQEDLVDVKEFQWALEMLNARASFDFEDLD